MPSIVHRKGRKGVALKFVDAATGRVRFRQFPDEEAAREELDLVEKARRVALDPTGRTTLADYSTRWFQSVETRLSPGTAALYAWAFDQHLVPAFGQRPLRDITRGQLKDFLIKKLRTGLAKGTVSNMRSALRCCLEEALEDGLISSNPAAGHLSRAAGLSLTRAERSERPKALDAGQLKRFLATAQEKEPGLYQVFRFMVGTGVRPGEALALKWHDVDLVGGRALIRRTWSQRVLRETTKGGEPRTIDIARGLLEEMKSWDVARKERDLATGNHPEWVFLARNGRAFDLRVVEAVFHRVTAAAGLAPWHTPHHLRHTYASLALAGGESMYYVQKQLGHASISITVDLYGSWLPTGSQATADRIERSLSGENVTPNVTPEAESPASTRGRSS